MHLNARRGRRNRLMAAIAAVVVAVVALSVLAVVRPRGHGQPPVTVPTDESARAAEARRSEAEAFTEIERSVPPELRRDPQLLPPLPGDDPGQVARSGVDPAQLPPSATDPGVPPSTPPAPGSPGCAQAREVLLDLLEPALGRPGGDAEVLAQLDQVRSSCDGAVADAAAVAVTAWEQTWRAAADTRDPQGATEGQDGAGGPTRG